MARLAESFLSRYRDASFLKQKLSRALLYFCIFLCTVGSLVILASLLINPTALRTTGPVVGGIIGFSVAAMLILRAGYYNFAANMIVCITTLALALGAVARVPEAPHTIYTSSFYYLMVVIVMATLFCTRRWVVGLSAFIVILDIGIFFFTRDRLDPAALQASTSGVIHIAFSAVFITILSQLIAGIFASALRRLRGEFRKSEEQVGIIERLFQSAKDTSNQLAVMAQEMTASSVTFSETSHTQAASVEEITSAIEEISSGMELMNQGSRDQARSLDLLISHMEELSRIIDDVGRIAGDTMEQTNSTSTEARAGEESVRKMNGSLGKIVESSRDIRNIIGIIDDISDRINLLSLNAAIEAARAGDAGRGFAVVADEISKLADQTATSIGEIDKLIRSSNEEINKGMNDIMEVTAKITGVIERVNAIADGMNRIFEYVRKQADVNLQVSSQSARVRNKSNEITGGISEQKIALDEIVRSISEINGTTLTMVSESDRIAGDSRKITEMSGRLEGTINAVGK
ncbi:MAG: hypothetical protein EPN93_10185 [Spirochaetes bacterium]|nr:MAG: hypothetical protein EPN93_10185 [Spirochaetota bacterium]